MRPFPIAAALAAALALSACSTVTPLLEGPSVAAAAPQTIADAEKALTVAHLAYQAIGVSLRSAAISGVLHGADAAAARQLYDRCGDVLATADQADALANAQDVFTAVADAVALIARIDALIPK